MNHFPVKSNRSLSAVILAAGRGERLMPITRSFPKPLIKVGDNLSLLEHNFNQLKKIQGLSKIYVIIGYLSEQIHDVVRKFKNEWTGTIECVENANYAGTNNVTSMACFYEKSGINFGDTDAFFVLDGDTVLGAACIEKMNRLNVSTILTHKISAVGEWYFDGDDYVISQTHQERFYMCGVSFFETADFCKILKECTQAVPTIYWDEIAIAYLAAKGGGIETRSECRITYEIDTLNDLINYLGHDKASFIAAQVSEDGSARKLGGMTNLNYLIKHLDEAFVLRLPGPGTENFVNREREERVHRLVAGSPYSVKTGHFSGGTIKLTQYIPNSRTFQYHEGDQLTQIFNILSSLHAIKSKDPKTRRILYDEVLMYERYFDEKRINNTDLCAYRSLREHVLGIVAKADEDEFVLTHGDLVPENILVDEADNLFLIDYEYGGLVSPYWDYASLIAENEIPLASPVIATYIKNKDMLIKYLMLVEFVWSAWAMCKISEGDMSLDTYVTSRLGKCREWLNQFNQLEGK